MRLWNVSDGKFVAKLEGNVTDILSLDFMPQQTTLAAGSVDGNIYLWDIIGLTIQRIMGGHTGAVRSLVHTANGEILFSGSSDNTVRIWNVSSGAPIGSFRITGIANSLAISPDGTILAMGSEDGILRLWGISPSP